MTRATTTTVALVFALAGGEAMAAPRAIRDVRPLRLARGDTMVLEVPGVVPGQPVDVTIAGQLRRRGSQGIEPTTFGALGKGAAGDRVLVRVDEAFGDASGRLEQAVISVDDPTTRDDPDWLTPASWRPTIELDAPSLRALASSIAPASPRGWVVQLAVMIAVALVLHLLVAPVAGIIVVWERKIAGRMQSRLGPNRVGPSGWLQWLADAIKLLLKEDVVPADADPTLFRLSPYLKWMSVFATFVVLPISESAIVADLNVGVLYLLSVTSFTVIAILMGGWASNSKWSLLGGMRSAAQIVSYELPAAIALLPAAVMAGSLSPQEIVRAQGGLPHEWFLFANPLAFVSFFIYFVSALAEGNRTPFDLPEAESELVAGYFTEYSGFRFSIFFLAEWTNMVVLGAIVATMFLGGWNVPFASPDAIAGSTALRLASIGIMAAKVTVLVFVIIWIRWTLPRFRVDQLMDLCWKYFLPIGFAAFLGTAAWVWAAHAWSTLAAVGRWATFLVGGVGLAAAFVARVVTSFRATRLLYAERQFTLPFVERTVNKP